MKRLQSGLHRRHFISDYDNEESSIETIRLVSPINFRYSDVLFRKE